MDPETAQRLLDLSLSAQAADDVFKFGEYVFGYHPAAHHREMVDFINKGIELGEDTIVLEPRGFAKSSWGTTINTAFKIAKEKDLRVGLISKSSDHADAFSRGIRWTLERNERFKQVFGDLTSDAKWTDSEWLRKGSRWHGSQYVTLYAQGVGGQIVSKRFDVIVCDDILDKENTATPAQMAKVEDWFWQTLYPCLAPGGIVIMLGTRWAEGDLYEGLIKPVSEGGKGWRSLVRGALIQTKGHKVRSLWPELWTVERLMKLKDGMGSARFACAMLNDITGLMEGTKFQRRWLQHIPKLPEGKYTFRMGIDLASSVKERADYTARVITAEDRAGNFYVVHEFRDKIAAGHDKFVLKGAEIAANNYDDLAAIIIENQQYQSTLVTEMMTDYPRLPIRGKRADSDKDTRAEAVAAKYEAGKVFHLESLRDGPLETEMMSWGHAHDDLVDALGYSMDLGIQKRLVFGSARR